MNMQAVKTKRDAPASEGVVHSIRIADVKVVTAPDRIRTVLGSCIGVAVCDLTRKIGGLAHVILPDSSEGSGYPGKFADSAVEMLVDMLAEFGARRAHLVAKLGGGASMFGAEVDGNLGDRNVLAVRKQLRQCSIPIAAEDVGGSKGRKMLLDPATGHVEIGIIGEAHRII